MKKRNLYQAISQENSYIQPNISTKTQNDYMDILTFLAIIFALYGFTSSFIQSYFKSSDIIINGQQQKF